MCNLREALTRGKVGNEENFIFSEPSRLATGPKEPPLISGRHNGHTIMAATQIYLVLRLRMSGSVLQRPYTPWAGTTLPLLFIYFYGFKWLK